MKGPEALGAATVQTSHRRCGWRFEPNGKASFRVWAPRARNVTLAIRSDHGDNLVNLLAEESGYFCSEPLAITAGTEYFLRLVGDDLPDAAARSPADRPDPCSLWQPRGIPGPSAVYNPAAFCWTDREWKGVSQDDLVIYELHVGTFTSEGTFDAIISRLPALKELGINAIELMPVNQFPGDRNWGYDGVLPYAVQHSYGGPEALQRLINAAHEVGLAVILDVVYNHFGPEGCHLREFGPYFTDRYKTPWGEAINFDGPGSDPVRDYFLDNARMWFEDFHADGLRLDAVHAIFDLGAKHILRSLREVADDVAAATGREIILIGESDLNDPRMILPHEKGGHGLHAQWADDFHHSVHALLTGERRGYYCDYGEPSMVAHTLARPFLFEWTRSHHRDRKHGAPIPEETSMSQFVVCVQNHDQVGNRARGERLTSLLDSPSKQRLASSMLLLSPYIPLLFMGEEYGEMNPFPFFCSFCGDELLQLIREGRRREFSDFFATPDEVPDPSAPGTFQAARLSWSWPEGTFHAGLRCLYQDLLALRRTTPGLKDRHHRESRLLDNGLIQLTRGSDLLIHFNPTDNPLPLPDSDRPLTLLYSSESPRYAGHRTADTPTHTLLAHEAVLHSIG